MSSNRMSGSDEKSAVEKVESDEDDDNEDSCICEQGFVRLEGTHTTSTSTDDPTLSAIPEEPKEVRKKKSISFKKSIQHLAIDKDAGTKFQRVDEEPCSSMHLAERHSVVSPARLSQFIDLFDTYAKTLASIESASEIKQAATEVGCLEKLRTTSASLDIPGQSLDFDVNRKPKLPHKRSKDSGARSQLHRILELPVEIPSPQKATATVASQSSQTLLTTLFEPGISAPASQPDSAAIYTIESLVPQRQSDSGGCKLINTADSLASLNDGHRSSTPPCERAFNILHIEAASSPTSSAMYRPPLHLRLWSVLANFVRAVCICLQVNREFIFCAGFFIAFVVSASFLTAFFYRTLNSDPQTYHHATEQNQHHRAPVAQPRSRYALFGNT